MQQVPSKSSAEPKRLNWATTKVGAVKVTTWSKYKATEILDVLDAPPLRKVGVDPVVDVKQFGPYELAVRRFKPPTWEGAGPRLFHMLQETVEQRRAIVEMPVALVEFASYATVLTVWKKDTRNLFDLLGDESLSFERTERIARGIMRMMAKLHATGFIHGHAALNIVINHRDTPMFVDYTRMMPNDCSPLSILNLTHEQAISETLALILHMKRLESSGLSVGHNTAQGKTDFYREGREIRAQLDEEYFRVFYRNQ